MKKVPLKAEEEIMKVGQLLENRGWSDANAGNCSIRCDQNHFLVSATGSRMRDIKSDPKNTLSLIKLYDKYGFICVWKKTSPTSEIGSHLAIYNAREIAGKSVNAVLHCHPIPLIALEQMLNEEKINYVLSCCYPRIKKFLPEGIGIIPYMEPGSKELIKATAKKFEKYKMVIWAQHGVIAAGETLEEAFDLIDVVNKGTQIYLTMKG